MSEKFLPCHPADDYSSGDDSDITLARAFALLAEMIDECSDTDGFALWISTCRNCFLTLNAQYEDIRQVLGHGKRYSLISQAIYNVAHRDIRRAKSALDPAISTLKQYKIKQECWNNRQVYFTHMESWKQKRSAVDRRVLDQALDRVLTATRDGSSEWDAEYVSISLAESARIASLKNTLESAWTILSKIADLVDATIVFIAKSSETQLQFALNEGATQDGIAKIGVDLRALAELDEGIAEEAVATALQESEQISSSQEVQIYIDKISNIALSAIERLYIRLSSVFRANLGTPPLPKPYIIDLTECGAHCSSAERSQVQLTNKNLKYPKPNNLKLALVSSYNLYKAIREDSIVYSDIDASELFNTIKGVIESAANKKSNAVVFPELFFPASHLQQILELADSHNITIIGGQEGVWEQNRYSNMVCIRFPERAAEYRQYKQKPSYLEPESEHFFSKGGQVVFQNTPIGTFSVAICSDFREFDVVRAIEDSSIFPDIVIVCSLNPHHEIFPSLALADAYRLHSYVAIVNSFPTGGKTKDNDSLLVAPLKSSIKQPEVSSEMFLVSGHECSLSLKVFDLDFGSLLRDRSRPSSPFIAPPRRRFYTQNLETKTPPN